MPDMSAIAGTVSGRVQGVGYRVSSEWKARRLGLSGWVRNLPDGRVEFFAQGSPEQVDEFRAWLDEGPPAARVSDVHVSAVDPQLDLTSFNVR